MSKIQTKKRHRNWPRPKCPLCLNPIEFKTAWLWGDNGAEHQLCKASTQTKT